MPTPPKDYKLTAADKELINKLLLELATELDLHYDDEDMFALAPSFLVIKEGCVLLERLQSTPHPDILKVLSRYNKSNQ